MSLENLGDNLDEIAAQTEDAIAAASGGSYNDALAFTPDPSWYLPATDYDIIRGLVGVTSSSWPDVSIQSLPYLPTALLDARARFGFDWATLAAIDAQWLRLGLIFETAALLAPQTGQQKGGQIKQGRLTVMTTAGTTLSAADFQSKANDYFARVTIPAGTEPVVEAPLPEPRRLIGRAPLFGVPGRLF